MRARLMMFARPVVAAVTLLVFMVVVAFIHWRGVFGMPMLPITLAPSEQVY